MENGTISTSAGPLAPPTDTDMDRLMPIYGGNSFVRTFIISSNIQLMTSQPNCGFVIEGRSPRYDSTNSGRRIISLYLVASAKTAAELTGRSRRQIRRRNRVDRALLEGPLTGPRSGGHIYHIDRRGIKGMRTWAINIMADAGIL